MHNYTKLPSVLFVGGRRGAAVPFAAAIFVVIVVSVVSISFVLVLVLVVVLIFVLVLVLFLVPFFVLMILVYKVLPSGIQAPHLHWSQLYFQPTRLLHAPLMGSTTESSANSRQIWCGETALRSQPGKMAMNLRRRRPFLGHAEGGVELMLGKVRCHCFAPI